MSLNLGVMSAAVTLDDADYRKKLSGLEGASESSFRKIAKLAAGYLTMRGMFSFAGSAVKEFSRLEEANNKFVNVFRDIPSAADEVSSSLAKMFDLSEQSVKEMLSGTGDLLTGFGFTQKGALDLAKAASTLGVDLASYQNYAGGAKGATEAITKAMLGETESMKALGVVIKKDSDEYKSLVSAFQGGGLSESDFAKVFGAEGGAEYKAAIEQFRNIKNLTEQQASATAVLAIAHRQSINAIGDYNRPGETFAQTQMKMAQNTEKAMASIGTFLSSGIHPAIGGLNDLVAKFNDADKSTQNLILRSAGLSAAFLLVAKSGALAKANSVLSSVSGAIGGGGFSGIKEKAEADVVASTENLKRAEYAKTDAFREAHAAAQSVRIARLSVQEQEAAVNSARANLSSAQASGDAAQILTAKKQLAVATNNLTKAQLAESTATQSLAGKHAIARTACAQHAVAEKACAVANTTNAAAATVSGRAHVVLSAGLAKARVAANAFAASLGPIGAAMIALSAVYMAFQYLSEKNRNELEAHVDASRREAEAAEESARAHASARAEDTSRLERLQELSRYERLNSAEKEEAKTLVDALTKKYGDLGIQLDAVTGKLTVGTDAWKKMNAEQAREIQSDLSAKYRSSMNEVTSMQIALRDELSSFWKNSIYASGIASIGNLMGSDDNTDGDFSYRAKNSDDQQEIDRMERLSTWEKKIAALEALRNKQTQDGDKEKAASVDALIKKMELLLQREKDYNAFVKARKEGSKVTDTAAGEDAAKAASEKAREKSKSERAALDSLTEKEWDVKFNVSGLDEQITMLDGKIGKVFERQSGKYSSLDAFKGVGLSAEELQKQRDAMTEQELKDLQEIIELENRRSQIEKRIADDKKRSAEAFQTERESYDDLLRDREKKQADKAVEREIKQKQDSGDTTGAEAIMQREYDKAREAAKNMQREYEQAVKDAEADGVLTDEEKKKIQELKRDMQRAMSDEDKWSDRVGDTDKKTEDNRKTAVAWSSELLAAQLGGSVKPQEETAKNTKRSMELLRDIKDGLKTTSSEVLG